MQMFFYNSTLIFLAKKSRLGKRILGFCEAYHSIAQQYVIDNKLNPLKANFSYLIGKSVLPLLTQTILDQDEKSFYIEDEVLQGKGIFQDRLRYLSHTARLLKEGQSQELVLPLLFATVNVSLSSITTNVALVCVQ